MNINICEEQNIEQSTEKNCNNICQNKCIKCKNKEDIFYTDDDGDLLFSTEYLNDR